jgi:hypothetical protein
MDTRKNQPRFVPSATLQDVLAINNFIKSPTENKWRMNNDNMKDNLT